MQAGPEQTTGAAAGDAAPPSGPAREGDGGDPCAGTSEPAVPAHPPTAPGHMQAVAIQRAPVWPNVIGIIGVVLGLIGALISLWTAASMVFSESYLGMVHAYTPGGGGGALEGMARSIRETRWASVAIGVMGLVMCVWLVWASIGLLRKSERGARLMVLWAWAAVPAVFAWSMVQAWVQFVMMGGVFETAANAGGPGPPPGFWSGLSIVMALVQGVFNLMMGLALPVTVLIIMRRASAREHVAQWGRRAAGTAMRA